MKLIQIKKIFFFKYSIFQIIYKITPKYFSFHYIKFWGLKTFGYQKYYIFPECKDKGSELGAQYILLCIVTIAIISLQQSLLYRGYNILQKAYFFYLLPIKDSIMNYWQKCFKQKKRTETNINFYTFRYLLELREK